MLGRVLPLVALVVALAVPVAELPLIEVARACCCPDPDRCHCPDHELDPSQPTIRACHTTQTVLASAPLPVFAAPLQSAIPMIASTERPITHDLDRPHAPPAVRRPDAPS